MINRGALMALVGASALIGTAGLGYDPPAYSYRSANARAGSHLPAPGKPKRKRKFKGSKAAKRASRRAAR